MKKFYGKSIAERINELQNIKVTFIGYDYKGKGRPRKYDYVTLKVNEVRDYWATGVFLNGFNTTYINEGELQPPKQVKGD